MTVKFSDHLEAGITGNPDDPSNDLNFGHLFTNRANTPLLNQLFLTMERPIDSKASVMILVSDCRECTALMRAIRIS